MSRDEFNKRKTKSNTAKKKYEKNGKFNSRSIRSYQSKMLDVLGEKATK